MSSIKVLPVVTSSSPLQRLVDDYLAHCRARGLSPRTIETSYGFALQCVLLPWCADEGVTRVEELDMRTLDRLSASLLTRISSRGKPLSKHSIHSYLRPVRQLLTWAAREGEDVKAKPQMPKLPRRRRDVLSREEITRMEDAVPTERDRLIIRIFGDCGLRLSELTQLRIGDVVRSGRGAVLDVDGKGRRQRRVPLPPSLVRRMERHIRGIGDDDPKVRIFWALRRDRHGLREPLTESGVSQLIGVAAERARIGRNVHPHLLRHSWMTEMLRSGMNPIQLSVIAGASPEVIAACYEHLTEDDAQNALIRALTVSDQRHSDRR